MIKTERQAMIFLAMDTTQDFVTNQSYRRIKSGPSREKRSLEPLEGRTPVAASLQGGSRRHLPPGFLPSEAPSHWPV